MTWWTDGAPLGDITDEGDGSTKEHKLVNYN